MWIQKYKNIDLFAYFLMHLGDLRHYQKQLKELKACGDLLP